MADTNGVRAADTVLAVLETVAWAGEPLGVTQIAARLQATKSAIFRHLQTLVDRAYLVQDSSTNRYRLGPKAFLIAHRAPPSWDLAQILEGLMREVRDQLGLAVVLSTPSPRGAFVAATLPGLHPIEIGVRPGSELAMHGSAQGKVFLAFNTAAVLPGRADLPRLTEHTITDPAVLAAEIETVRQQGYAVAPEQVLLGCNAIAAPVWDHRGALVAALAFVGSIQHLHPNPQPEVVQAVLALAARASRQLGWEGRPNPLG